MTAATSDDAAPRLAPPKLAARDVGVSFSGRKVLEGVSLAMQTGRVTALMGPSGCGKSTFLRTLNRMTEEVQGAEVEGQVLLDGHDVRARHVDAVEVRRRIGMVFQQSNPFPKTIFDNVAFGLRIAGERDKALLATKVERALRGAGLWEEVKDRLGQSALALSGGQQQRLCIARAVAVEPEVLLMDEPASALDPAATAKIEELMLTLRDHYAVVLVTHSMSQAKRVGDDAAFFFEGRLIESGSAAQVLEDPRAPKLRDWIAGRFG